MASRAKIILCVESATPESNQRAASLREAGYTVVLTADPKEALAIFITVEIDAVLLDIHLGNTKKKSLRSAMNSIRPKVPVVALCPPGYRSTAARTLFEHIFREGDGPGSLLSILSDLI